jgi:hypothetical protein
MQKFLTLDAGLAKAIAGFTLVAAVAGSAASCGVQSAPEHAKREPKPGKAELPATPDLDPPQPPVQYPEDRAYSVSGLLTVDKKTLAEEIWIRGYVASISVCPLSEKLCKPAPHLWLSDQADGLGRRLLVGGERDLEARHLLVGQRVSLKGRFAQSSADGVYFSPTGMLLLTPLDPPPEIAPEGQPGQPKP